MVWALCVIVDYQQLSPQWLGGNWCGWAHNLYIIHDTSCAQVRELPQSHCGDNREGALSICVCIYMYIIYIYTYIHIYNICIYIYIYRYIYIYVSLCVCVCVCVCVFVCVIYNSLKLQQTIYDLRKLRCLSVRPANHQPI